MYNYRLKEYNQGWIVERKVYSWHIFFGVKEKWVHVTHYLGLPDKPFYYKTAEQARDGALDVIKQEINHSFFNQ